RNRDPLLVHVAAVRALLVDYIPATLAQFDDRVHSTDLSVAGKRKIAIARPPDPHWLRNERNLLLGLADHALNPNHRDYTVLQRNIILSQMEGRNLPGPAENGSIIPKLTAGAPN